jgi:hypothetical protein
MVIILNKKRGKELSTNKFIYIREKKCGGRINV